MDTKVSRRALEALAGEHGLPILRFLRDREWTLASQVAEALGIHTTTASKYLAAFHEAGFLDRRSHPAKRPTSAYRLLSPVVRIEFDLGPRAEGEDTKRVAITFVEALLAATSRVGGSRLEGALVHGMFRAEEWRPTLDARFAATTDSTMILDGLIDDARRETTSLVGTATSERLVRIALDTAAEGHGDVLAALRLEGALP